MKKIIILFIMSINTIQGQVGVNTTSPTKDLDVNGELRIRTLPTQSLDNSQILTADANGNIGKINNFYLFDVASSVASSNVDFTLSPAAIVNNINLGLSITVTIPANKEALVIITYSVPMGISSGTCPVGGYYGIRFLKDGVEAPAGSRKSTCVCNSTSANMVTISNFYSESFTPSTTSRTIVYTLNGYIEKSSTSSHTYRFNMWSPTGSNFNWGFATINKQVFLK